MTYAIDRPQTFWGGVRVGAAPAALLVVVVGVTFLFSLLARALTASGGFFAQRQATVIALAVGGIIAAAGYVATVVWTWRRMTRWSHAGVQAPVYGVLVALVVTALLVLVPLIVAFVAPQQPAP